MTPLVSVMSDKLTPTQRLETSLQRVTALEAELTAAVTERDAALTAKSAVSEQLAATLEHEAALTAELTAAKANIQTLTVAVADADKRASIKAQEILAQTGCPPVALTPQTSPAASTLTPRQQYEAIADPQARAEFWAKHRNEILT